MLNDYYPGGENPHKYLLSHSGNNLFYASARISGKSEKKTTFTFEENFVFFIFPNDQ
jgi:hypothetical protein